MKALFEILPENVDANNCKLLCEINNDFFSFTIKNEENNLFEALGVFEFEKGSENKAHDLQELIQSKHLLQGKFARVIIMHSFPESVLIPFTLYSSLENENVLNLVHGDLHGYSTIYTDLITESGFYNAYRVPDKISKVIEEKFENAENNHQYSVLLKQTISVKDTLQIIFYPGRMLVRVFNNGQNKLLNSFCFHTPEDVSYTLLNICKQYDLKNIPLEIGGMIEKDSSLFIEMYKYFDTIHFSLLPGNRNFSEEILKLPAHYFSHIFAIDT